MAKAERTKVTRKVRKKVLKEAKGYFGHKHRGWKTAQEAVKQARWYEFRDRKQTKRNLRNVWVKRINNAARECGISYSQLIQGLKLAQIEINRKMLSEIAIADMNQFKQIVVQAQAALANKPKTKTATTSKDVKSKDKHEKPSLETKHKEEHKAKHQNHA